MSSKPAQASELSEALSRSQAAKANKVNADRQLKRAETKLTAARKEAEDAAAEVRDAEAALASVLKKDLTKVMKDSDMLLAIAGIVAGAASGDSAPAAPRVKADPAPASNEASGAGEELKGAPAAA